MTAIVNTDNSYKQRLQWPFSNPRNTGQGCISDTVWIQRIATCTNPLIRPAPPFWMFITDCEIKIFPRFNVIDYNNCSVNNLSLAIDFVCKISRIIWGTTRFTVVWRVKYHLSPPPTLLSSPLQPTPASMIFPLRLLEAPSAF